MKYPRNAVVYIYIVLSNHSHSFVPSGTTQAAFPQLFLSAAEVPRRRDAAAHAAACAHPPALGAPESLERSGGRSSDVFD